MAERTWKYERVARTKKNTIVSMGKDEAWIEIGRIKALIAGKRWMYASGPEVQELAAIESQVRVRTSVSIMGGNTWGGRGRGGD